MVDCIAIDGVSSSGKSTVSKIIAKKLNYMYLDTGAMYRVVTAYCLKNKIDFYDIKKLQQAIANINIEFKKNSLVYCNGKNFTNIIREKEVCDKVSIVSSIQIVREFLVKKQKEIAYKFDVVMDGRDIGTNVAPFSKNKFFLVCDLSERVKRRYKENLQKNIKCCLKDIEQNLKERDFIDQTRKINPLKKALDAIEIDTTFLTIEEVVNLILDEINKKRAK
ncbi:MAG: (d)CMP kinase [Bacilli bacterium]|nr:(d)CMP kinase [Bacilli bacterium]